MHGYKGNQGAEKMQELEYLLYHVRVHDRDAELAAAAEIQMRMRHDPQPAANAATNTWKGFARWNAAQKEYTNEKAF